MTGKQIKSKITTKYLTDIEKEKKTILNEITPSKGGSRAAATSKMERFVIIVKGFQTLTINTKRSISDVAAALDPPLLSEDW